MKDIQDHVVTKWAPQWKQLGKELNVDQSLINIIQHDHGNDCVECCSRMLEAWLEQNTHDTTTWETLTEAIDNLPIDLGMSSCHLSIHNSKCILYVLKTLTQKSTYYKLSKYYQTK